jgi:hypothetical protein
MVDGTRVSGFWRERWRHARSSHPVSVQLRPYPSAGMTCPSPVFNPHSGELEIPISYLLVDWPPQLSVPARCMPLPIVTYETRPYNECAFKQCYSLTHIPRGSCHWIFTIITNIDAIADALRRSPIHITNFLRHHFAERASRIYGAQLDCYYDFVNRRTVIADPVSCGRNQHGVEISPRAITPVLLEFVDRFVTCRGCASSETLMNAENFECRCEQCGCVYSFSEPVNYAHLLRRNCD